MRPHFTTTFERIVSLYDEERRLLDAAGEGWLTRRERERFQEVRASLAALWPERRRELVFESAGPPRMISAPDPRSHRQIAYGIAPLPSFQEERL